MGGAACERATPRRRCRDDARVIWSAVGLPQRVATAAADAYRRPRSLRRAGRRDPLEPGEEILPEAERLVQAYPGVVAWYCGLRLERYATCFLDYNDVFGVYEWGAGGIVHLHCLAWPEGLRPLRHDRRAAAVGGRRARGANRQLRVGCTAVRHDSLGGAPRTREHLGRLRGVRPQREGLRVRLAKAEGYKHVVHEPRSAGGG